ncbi:MAG: iron-containing alcohol dehydrogenase [Coriobacteriales bacterium]|nr:iron-containing alcohol dehydrogenase [Coriobacteriales bacterium]
MRSFEFYAPTKVVFGPGSEERAGELVKEFGGTKALVHFGGQSAKRSGLLDRVVASLDAQGIGHVLFGGVEPNPRLSLVREGIKLVADEGIDFILAVGGGSVIDSAKAIAYGAADPARGDVWDFYLGQREATAAMPIGVVPTVAATGSEMSGSSVITENKTGTKRGYENNLSRPRFALMNPELTLTVSPYQTASGCVDILMHTMERYFNAAQPMYTTDRMAEALMRSVIYNARELKANPGDLQARAEVMWAAALSHNDVTGPRALGDWSCHQLEHELSGMFDVAHGAGLAAIWGSWARFVMDANPARFERFAMKVMDLEYHPEQGRDLAIQGIEAMEAFFRELGMPTSIPDLGINPSDKQLECMARGASRNGTRTLGTFRVLTEQDMLAIYRHAMG